MIEKWMKEQIKTITELYNNMSSKLNMIACFFM